MEPIQEGITRYFDFDGYLLFKVLYSPHAFYGKWYGGQASIKFEIGDALLEIRHYGGNDGTNIYRDGEVIGQLVHVKEGLIEITSQGALRIRVGYDAGPTSFRSSCSGKTDTGAEVFVLRDAKLSEWFSDLGSWRKWMAFVGDYDPAHYQNLLSAVAFMYGRTFLVYGSPGQGGA